MRRDTWGGVAGLLLLVAVAYVPAAEAGFVWDDDSYVTDNVVLRSAEGLREIWTRPAATPQYYPLVFTTFWAEYRLWGPEPAGYHRVNIFLHGLNSALLWAVLRRLGLPGAWFAAALFALHPVHVESVAWITERKNVLSALGYLAALLAYWRFAARESGGWGWYGLALVLFLGALWSKTVTCSLPAALVLLLWWKHGRVARRDWLALAPMFALGLVLGLNTAWLEKTHVGARGADWLLSPAQRVLIAGRALWFYAGKLAFPSGLAFFYPRWRVDPRVWWQDAYPLAALGVLAGLWAARRRIGRGPLVAALLFAGTLAPSLGFFDVYPMRYSFVADHFQYLASAALLAPAGVLAARAARRLPRDRAWAAPAIGGLILAILAILTFARAAAFHDQKTLWVDTIRANPDAWIAHNNLGRLLLEERDVDAARRHFEAALRANPDYVESNDNLGLILEEEGRIGPALEHLDRALKADPNYWLAHYHRGLALRKRGEPERAACAFAEALRLHPGHVAAHVELGMTLAERGRGADAGTEFARAARLAESAGVDRYTVEVLDEAAWMLATAPAEGVRDGPLALRLARLASRATGDRHARSLNALAAAYAETGQFDEAAAVARRALALPEAARTPALTDRLRRALLDYEAGRPHRDPPAGGR